MNPTSILRLAFDHPVLDRVLALVPAERIESSWHAGAPRSAKRVNERSGANVFVAEADGLDAVLLLTVDFCQSHGALFRGLAELSVSAAIDVGFVMSANLWSQSARLKPAALHVFADLGVGLEISVYRGDDDEEPASP